jgi:hypothetical protein
VLTKLVLNRDGMASARNDTDFNRDGHETFLVQTINILSEGRIIMIISDRTHSSPEYCLK